MNVVHLSIQEADDSIEDPRRKLEWIYRNYSGFIYHEALRITRDHYLAEDAVNETFLQLIHIIDDIRMNSPKELAKFIQIVARNRTIDYIRKMNRVSPEMDYLLDAKLQEKQEDPESVAVTGVFYERLLQKMSFMDEKYRLPLSLKIQGYQVHEISRYLNLTPQNTRLRIFRARKMLLDVLTEDEIE